jgi:hypothetical protein
VRTLAAAWGRRPLALELVELRGSWCGMRDGMATKKDWPPRLRRCEGVRKPSTTPCFGGLATGDGGDSETSSASSRSLICSPCLSYGCASAQAP